MQVYAKINKNERRNAMKKIIAIIISILLILSTVINAFAIDSTSDADYSAFNSVFNISKCYNKNNYSFESFSNLEALINKYSNIEAKGYDQAYIDYACESILTAIYELKAYFNISISSNKNISIEYNKNTNSTNQNKYSILQGTSIKLIAPTYDGYRFIGWFEKTSKRYFSFDNEYSFTANSNLDLEAVYSSNDCATLYFKNQSEQIVEAIKNRTDEWARITDISNILPDVPFSYGKDNGYWIYDNNQILEALLNGIDTTIYCSYEIENSTDYKPINNLADLEFSYNEQQSIGSFLMHAKIPDNLDIANVGIAFLYGSQNNFDPSNTILTLDNRSTISQFGNLIEDLYIVNTKTSNRNWAAVGFISYYENNQLKTYYTNQVNIVNNSWINSNNIQETFYYSSLESAIEDANNSTTANSTSNLSNAKLLMSISDNTASIVALNDLSASSLTINGDIQINLDNHTLSIDNGEHISFAKKLDIENGKIVGANSVQLLKGELNSTLLLKNIELTQNVNDSISSNSYLINTNSIKTDIRNCKLSLTGAGKKGLTAIGLNLLNANGTASIADSIFYTKVENGYLNGNIEAVGTVNLYRNNCEIGRNRSSISVTSTSSDIWFHDYCFSMNSNGGCKLYVDGGRYESNLGTVYSPEHDIANVAFKLRPKAASGSTAIFEEKTAPLYVHGGNAGLSIQETEAYIYGGDYSSPDHGGVYSIATSTLPLSINGGKFYTTTIEQDGVENVIRYGAFYCGGNNIVNISNSEIVGGKFGIRLKAATANKGSVTIQNSTVYGDQQAFSISQGTLTINKGTTTKWGNSKLPETEEAGGTLIDNR